MLDNDVKYILLCIVFGSRSEKGGKMLYFFTTVIILSLVTEQGISDFGKSVCTCRFGIVKIILRV